MKPSRLLLILLILFACKQPDGQSDPNEALTYIPTRNLQETANFPVGLSTQSNYLNLPQYTQTLDLEFNSLTAEYEMKQNILHEGPDQYNWDPADQLVNYAKDRGIRVHGHALLWHSAIPAWLDFFQGTDEEFTQAVKSFIQEAVSRYSSDVTSWDVVNEAFEDGGGWRNTLFLERMGEDYVAQCFQFAHEADSSVLLFYNDYGTIWDDDKLEDMLKMLDDFQARGIPIDGVGLQMHINYDWPKIQKIQQAVDAIVSRELMVHFSEIDIRVNPKGKLDEITYDRAVEQQHRLREITELYQGIPADLQYGMTFWGLRDSDSWLIGFWGNPEWPLLFDEGYRYKLVHKGFIEAF